MSRQHAAANGFGPAAGWASHPLLTTLGPVSALRGGDWKEGWGMSRTLLPAQGGARRKEALLWRWALLLALAGICLCLSLIGLGAGVVALAVAVVLAVAAAVVRASRRRTPVASLLPVVRGEASVRVRRAPAIPAAPRL